MRLNTLIKKLESIGVKPFSARPDSITYCIDRKEGTIDVDFWSIDRILTNKHGHETLYPMSIRFLMRKDSRIHTNIHDHVFSDVAEVRKDTITEMRDTNDLLGLIQNVQSIGLRLK